MATTFTSKAKLGTPSPGDTGFTPVFAANAARLDGTAAVGGLCVTAHEQPTSASLLVDVAAGSFRAPWGQPVAYAGAASQAMPASATTYVWLTTAGALATGTAWPATAHVPLAVVVAGATTITSVTDARNACSAVVPVAQPTMGAATAGASYTATEQAMLQAVYDAVRTLGLGS